MFVVGLFVCAIPGSMAGGYAVAAVILRAIAALPAPAAYVLAGFGLGRVTRPLFRGAVETPALQLGLGLGLVLFLSHFMAMLGLFASSAGAYVAIAPIAIGSLLAVHQGFAAFRRARGVELRLSLLAPISALGLALLLVAACNPPGALWRTEFGAYDVLEYHLQLPQEWLHNGRLWPLPHNVYSYLPSYFEAAFLHTAAMTFPPSSPTPNSLGDFLLAGNGDRLISCQLLHTLFTIAAAWLTARLAHRLAGALAAPLAFALVLLTPWAIVTGSMAYNEMALCAMLATALIAACETGIAPWQRALLTGVLCASAASIKPTGVLFAGVPAAILLLFLSRPREWPVLMVSGGLGALAIMAPWLTRNVLASGNPIFPFAAHFFPNAARNGSGAWDYAQAARYVSAHAFHGSIADRIRLLFLPDPAGAPPGLSAHRGLFHPQWAALFPATITSAALLLVSKRLAQRTSATAVPAALPENAPRLQLLPFPLLLVMLGLLAQVGLWLFTTHLQSRFLLPLLPASAVLCSAAAAFLAARARALPRTVILLALPIVQLTMALVTFLNENHGEPNIVLIPGPGMRTGQAFLGEPRESLGGIIASAPPELFINLTLPPEGRVFLLGDSTPLYYTHPPIYRTTYDTSPLADLPIEQWTAAFRAAGATAVLINLGELQRLEQSGWNQPGVTAASAAAWMQRYARPVVPPQRWEKMGIFLVEVPPESREPAQPSSAVPSTIRPSS